MAHRKHRNIRNQDCNVLKSTLGKGQQVSGSDFALALSPAESPIPMMELYISTSTLRTKVATNYMGGDYGV
ncbi:unnamed protein product [Boreogadus saida]